MSHSRDRRLRLHRPATVLASMLAMTAAVIPATVSAAASGRPGPAAPHVPALHWRACDNGFQCATAQVPLDYAHPGGQQISIAVIRHLAGNPARRGDTLFANGGGPNEQIKPFVAEFSQIPAGLRANFTIVSFDPRGFGFSTPFRCFPSMAAENKFLAKLPPFPVGARQEATWERTTARYDARCARLGGPLLAHMSTADVARDMNLLREAVGAPTLDYIGISYGTGLGASYANLFPATAGRMVLDGNLDPVAWTGGGRLPGAIRLGEDVASAATMRSFLDLCGKATTSACAFSAGSPAATRAKWHTLLHRVRVHPVSLGGQTVTYPSLITSLPLPSVSKWQAGAGLLQQLWTASGGTRPAGGTRSMGVTTTPLKVRQAQAHGGRGTAGTRFYTGGEQGVAVVCGDSHDSRRPADYAAAARLGYARAGGFGPANAWSEEVCADWPADAGQDSYTGPWNRPTPDTILVIGNTGDPVTPYQNSVAMSHDLASARLLTVRGYGHTEFLNPSTCAIRAEVRYLTTGALPPAGTVCQQNGTPFPAPAQHQRAG